MNEEAYNSLTKEEKLNLLRLLLDDDELNIYYTGYYGAVEMACSGDISVSEESVFLETGINTG